MNDKLQKTSYRLALEMEEKGRMNRGKSRRFYAGKKKEKHYRGS